MKHSRILLIVAFIFIFIVSHISVVNSDTQRIKDNGQPVTAEEWNQAVDYLIQNIGENFLINMDTTIKEMKENDRSGKSFKRFRNDITSNIKSFLQRSRFNWGDHFWNKYSFELLKAAISKVRSERNIEGQQSKNIRGFVPYGVRTWGDKSSNSKDGEVETTESSSSSVTEKENSDKESPKVFWKGTITVKHHQKPAKITFGAGDSFWRLQVRLMEDKRVPVLNDKGEAVGVFVTLKDSGATWYGENIGFYENPSVPVAYDVYGKKSGAGKVVRFGVIYFSLVDDDPLSDILPNGTYWLWGTHGLGGPGPIVPVTVTTIYPNGATTTKETTIFLLFKIGKCFIGNTTNLGFSGSITVDEVRSMLFKFNFAEGHDTVLRTVKNGVMKGSYSGWSPFGENRGIYNEVSWDITREEDRVRIDYPPKDWRPVCERMGLNLDRDVEIHARILDDGVVGKWRFTLFDVTNEKGYCMNAGDDDSKDLSFAEGQKGLTEAEETKDGWKIETLGEEHEVRIKIRAKDYGAWGKLKATVVIDGQEYNALTNDGKDYVTIPYDEDENRIADAWEEKYGVKGEPPDSDNDNKPEEIEYHNGDGFTNYEEYRGFMIGGGWQSTDPKYMDIFIYDELGYGVGYFENTKLAIHLINQDEYDSNRVVNFNRGYATLKEQQGQKGLYIIEKDLGEYNDMDVIVAGKAKNIGTPNVVDWVAINTIIVSDIETIESFMKELYGEHGEYFVEEKIKEKLRNEKTITTSDGQHISVDTIMISIGSILAHELGHAVNLPHHGDPLEEIELTEERGKVVAIQGGKWSGDVNCVMRYKYADEYLGKDGKFYKYPHQITFNPTGYCTSKKGTEINAGGNVAGDATFGECWKRITLKGYNQNGE